MTVGMIMILLYGAGGEPGIGEIPMIQISYLLLSNFPKLLAWQGVLGTNIVKDHLGNEMVKYIAKYDYVEKRTIKCQTVKRLQYVIKKVELVRLLQQLI